MTSKKVLVGVAPTEHKECGQPLAALAPNKTGWHIAQMCGMDSEQYAQAFDRVNICPYPMLIPLVPREWYHYAENLAACLLRGRRVILLGASVARCFGVAKTTYAYCAWYGQVRSEPRFTVGDPLPFDWAVLPHPSGRNRWYNESQNRKHAEHFLRNL